MDTCYHFIFNKIKLKKVNHLFNSIYKKLLIFVLFVLQVINTISEKLNIGLHLSHFNM